MMELLRHPLSSAFPNMNAEEFTLLIDDIRTNGLREMGYTLDGMVLDGWHRYRACIEAGKPFRCDEYRSNDPVAFVLSKNAHRRHLTAGQRAEAVVRCAEWAKSGRPKTEKGDTKSPPAQTVSQMAKAANVDERTVQRAKVAHEAGLGDAVRDGKISVNRAAEIAKLPERERAAVITAREQPKTWRRHRRSSTATLEKRIDKLKTENDALKAENKALKDELEQVREGAAEAVAQAETATALLEGDPAKEILKLKAEVQRVEPTRDDYMRQCGEMRKQIKWLEGRLTKVEAEREKYRRLCKEAA